MSKMHHDPLIDQDLGSLPADVQPLVEWLAADGAGWRAALPSTATLDAAVTTLALGGVEMDERGEQVAARDAVPSGPVPGMAAVGRGRTRAGRAPVRLAGLAGIAAMVTIVTLIASVFAFQAGGVHRGRTATGPKPTATPPPDTAWVDQPQLYVVNTGTGDRIRLPVVAPSDARVVYESYTQYTDQTKQHQRLVLQRSDDGGATWHALPNPVPGVVDMAAETDQVVFIVSPLDAHTVILQESLPVLSHQSFPCPAPFAQYVHDEAPCQAQYRSTDGGATWVPLVTPDYVVSNHWLMGLRPPLMAYFQGNEAAALRAQGGRLYSAVFDAGRYFIRIVASEDGGASWHMADEALVARGVSIEDYAATPTGNTVFAVTSPNTGISLSPGSSPLTLWRSDDAGGTWRRVGPLPTQYDDGLVAVPTTDAAQPLLYLDAPHSTDKRYPYGSYLADDLNVSTDGGRTWESAPTAGFPTQLRTYPGLVGTLTDGSVVVGCVPDVSVGLMPPASFLGPGTNIGIHVAFYAWKLGAPTWRQLTPPLTQGMSSLVITTAGGQDTLWATDTFVDEYTDASGNHYGTGPTHYHVWRFRLP